MTHSSVKEQRNVNSSIRLGKKRYGKLKELLELTANDDLNQFKE
jgi:hypothetical protein